MTARHERERGSHGDGERASLSRHDEKEIRDANSGVEEKPSGRRRARERERERPFTGSVHLANDAPSNNQRREATSERRGAKVVSLSFSLALAVVYVMERIGRKEILWGERRVCRRLVWLVCEQSPLAFGLGSDESRAIGVRVGTTLEVGFCTVDFERYRNEIF